MGRAVSLKQGLRRAPVWQGPASPRRSDPDRLSSPDVAALLHLQRTAGNRAVAGAVQRLGMVGVPLPVQRVKKAGRTKKIEAAKKAKADREAAKLKKDEEAAKLKKDEEGEGVSPPLLAPKTPAVKNPADSRKRYDKLSRAFDSAVNKWRGSYTVSLRVNTIVEGVKEDLAKIEDSRSQLEQYTGYVSRMAVEAAAAIKPDQQSEDAERSDDWAAFERECIAARPKLDKTLAELKKALEPALKAEADQNEITRLRGFWAGSRDTSREHVQKHMSDTGLTELQYYEAAKKLVDKQKSGTKDVLSASSTLEPDKTVFFDPGNGFFAVSCQDGIVSMFKPSRGRAYYNQQVARP